MGMTAADRAKRDAEISALAPEEKKPDPDKPTCKHGCATIPCRHTRTEDKHKKHLGKELRGVPLVGAGPGCIAGTRPGDSAAQLNQAARDIVIANLALQKAKAEKLRQVRADIKRKPTTRT